MSTTTPLLIATLLLARSYLPTRTSHFLIPSSIFSHFTIGNAGFTTYTLLTIPHTICLIPHSQEISHLCGYDEPPKNSKQVRGRNIVKVKAVPILTATQTKGNQIKISVKVLPRERERENSRAEDREANQRAPPICSYTKGLHFPNVSYTRTLVSAECGRLLKVGNHLGNLQKVGIPELGHLQNLGICCKWE